MIESTSSSVTVDRMMVTSTTPVDRAGRRILAALDREPRATVGWLAEHLGLARGTVQGRIARLFAPGVLRPLSTTVRTESLGFAVRAFVTAEVDQSEFERAMAELAVIPEVIECLAISGESDLICQVVARDTDDLYRVGQRILRCRGIRRTSTSIALQELIPYRTAQLLAEGGQ